GRWLDWLARHKKWALALSALTLVAVIWNGFYFSSPGGERVRDWGLLVIPAVFFLGYLLLLKKRIQPTTVLPKGAAFRGLIAFQEADRARFFGRELDTITLFDRIRHEEFRFGVLYGDSGCGKTSLLKAGLMPKLWESGYIPLYCRSHADPLTALLQDCSRKSLISQKNGEPPQEYLQRVAGGLGGTLIVVCDQFEEFFVSLKSRHDREPFISFLVDCHNNPALPVKFLISLRSDFLHLIGSEFSGRIAEPLLNARLYHLSNFDARQAQDIIERSARAANLCFEPGFSAGVARDLAIMDTVLPSELQIVGEQLQTRRIFTLEEYRRSGGKERLVHAYLEDVVQSSGDALASRLVLRSLISDENTRLPLTLEEIARRAQQNREVAGAILNHFVRARIIGQVQDLEPWRYELMHEYLIDKINHITGKVMDATQKANRMLRQYLSNYSVDKRTRIPLSKLWAIRRYSDMVVEKAGQDLYRKSMGAGLFRWCSFALLCVLASTFAVAALSVREEWDEAILGDGHTGPARQVTFSPDGKRLLSGGEDGLVILWDFEKRLRLATLNENIGQVSTVAFSNDGKWLAAGSSTGDVVIWESAHLQRRALFRGHGGIIDSVVFSPDSRLLVSAGDDWRTVVWNVGSWEKRREFPYRLGYGNLLFLSNTLLMYHDGTLWDVTTGRTISSVCKEDWNYVALSPDHRRYLGVDALGRVSFEEPGVCSQPVEKIVHKDNGRAAAWSADGRWAATGAENIVFWDASTGTQLARLESAEVWSLAFSPDSRWLVSSHGDGSISVWDAAKRERVADLKQHSAPVSAVAFSPDGGLLASAGADQSIMIWNTASRLKAMVLDGHANAVNALAFSPDGKSLVSCDQSGWVMLWDLDQGARRWTFRKRGGSEFTHCLAFSPEGQWIAIPGGIYNSADHEMVVDLAASDVGRSYGLSFSPDGKLLASTSPGLDKLILLDTGTWRVSEEQNAPVLTEAVRVVCFSPDGQFLVTGSNVGDVRLWQVNPLCHLALIGRHKTRVKAVAFSPDGRRVVSASDDKTMALWDVAARRLVTQIGSHSASVASAAFSKDGRIASGEWDNSVRLYNSYLSLWGRRLNWNFLR
ncbi:MAG: WD40 repeat domain-containing protein, partial [Acidobacteriota bacterium]